MNTYKLSKSTLRLLVRKGKFSGMTIKYILSTNEPNNIKKWFNKLLATFISNSSLSTWGKAIFNDFRSSRMCLEHFEPKGECKCIPIKYESEKFDFTFFPQNLLNQKIKSGIYKNAKVKDIIFDQRYLRNLESKCNLKDPTLRKMKKHLIT